MTKDDLARAREWLAEAQSVTVLTGAGVSAESGIATFRGPGGVWEKVNPMELASSEGFRRDPRKVWAWYNARRRQLLEARPNPGHYALVELEKRVPCFGLITQNVDRLHQAAGSRNVVELHGNIWEVRCTGCGRLEDRTGVELPDEPHCDHCGAWLRPNVVWFGEELPSGAWRLAEEWTRRADVFLVVGTSAEVWPAAGLIYLAKDAGAKIIEINPEDTAATKVVDLALRGPSGQILPQIVPA
ncbi:MAG: NAD-dependent deacylase [Gemmatales bacterium]|nr:NAD-dependent deacylase [Gemmatales bacterium]MDW7994146.1 NAD-dependent deacylase [Gemmatales bacterium]